jgi:hypothetical protein
MNFSSLHSAFLVSRWVDWSAEYIILKSVGGATAPLGSSAKIVEILKSTVQT